LSENQNSTPDWNSHDAKTTTSSVGIARNQREDEHQADMHSPVPPIVSAAAAAPCGDRAAPGSP
jgi:hypothetical protein